MRTSREAADQVDTTTPRRSRREVVLAWCAALAVSGLYVANAAVHGALGAARNDDWVYYRAAFALARTGHLAFDPYSSTLLVGQVVAAQPVIRLFGAEVAPLQVAVALVSAVTLAASYFFFRHFLDAFWATFCVACLAVGPIWGGLSVSFMSDVPAVALQVLCLCAAVPALRGPRLRWGWLALSLGLALAAFSVREYSIAAAIAVLITAYLTHGRRAAGRRWVLLGLAAAGVVWVAVALSLFAWRSTIVTGPRALAAQIELGQRVSYVLVGLLTTTGFLLFPVALAVWRGGGWRSLRRWWPLVVGLITLFTITSSVLHYPLLVGNYLRLGGSYSGTIAGVAPVVFSEPVWWCLMAVANVATALLITYAVVRVVAGLAERRRRRASKAAPDPVMATRDDAVGALVDPSPRLALVFGLVTVCLVFVVCIISHSRPFDRYLVGAVPFLAAAALHASRSRAPQRVGRIVASAGLVVLAVVGGTQVDASATFDGTKWSLGTETTRLGYEASTVDAGYEWFGLHQPGPVIYNARREKNYTSWVTSLFDDARVCVLGQIAPRPTHRAPYAGEVARVSRVTLLGLRYTMIGRAVNRNCYPS